MAWSGFLLLLTYALCASALGTWCAVQLRSSYGDVDQLTFKLDLPSVFQRLLPHQFVSVLPASNTQPTVFHVFQLTAREARRARTAGPAREMPPLPPATAPALATKGLIAAKTSWSVP